MDEDEKLEYIKKEFESENYYYLFLFLERELDGSKPGQDNTIISYLKRKAPRLYCEIFSRIYPNRRVSKKDFLKITPHLDLDMIISYLDQKLIESNGENQNSLNHLRNLYFSIQHGREFMKFHSLWKKYFEVIEQMWRDVDNNWDEITNNENIKLIKILHDLNREIHSVCDSVIFLLELRHQRAAGSLIRLLQEITNLMAHLEQNPDKLENYQKNQKKGFKLTTVDFSKYLGLDYEGLEISRDIFVESSLLIHPTSIGILENKEPYDLEKELNLKKSAHSFLDLSVSVYLNRVEDYLSDETILDLHILNWATSEIIHPEQFDQIVKNEMLQIHNFDDLSKMERGDIITHLDKIKNRGLFDNLELTVDEKYEKENNEINLKLNDIEKTGEIRYPFEEKSMDFNIFEEYPDEDKVSIKEIYDFFNNLKYNISEAFIRIEKSQNDDLYLQLLSAFTYDSLELIDAIINLNSTKGYMESNLIHRIILENKLLMKYLNEYPEEVRRWDYLQKKQLGQKGNLRKYQRIDYKEFCDHLEKNNFENVLSRIEEKNFKEAKFFYPSFLQSSLEEKGIKTDDALYDVLSDFAHPNIDYASGPRMERNIGFEIHTISTSLLHISELLKILLSEYSQYIDSETKEILRNRINDIEEKYLKTIPEEPKYTPNNDYSLETS